MAMPKKLKLINIKTGRAIELSFEHALSRFRLEKQQNRKPSYKLEEKYIFDGNDIIRRTSNRAAKDQEGKGADTSGVGVSEPT